MQNKVKLLLGAFLLSGTLYGCGDILQDNKVGTYTKEEMNKINSEVSNTVEEAYQAKEDEKVTTGTNTDSTEVTETTSKKPVNTSGTVDKIPVEYVRVVDGDTAKVIYDGQEMSVRYLLIDTPESKHPKIGYQPYGQEASDFNKRLLDNANQVYLEFDIGARTDHYGRLLAYVWADDILINEAIVREGLAVKAYVKPPSTRHLDLIETAQSKAKEERKNVWSLNDYVNGEDFNGGSKVDGNKNYPQHIKQEDKSTKSKPATSKPATSKPATSKPTTSKPDTSVREKGEPKGDNLGVGEQKEVITATEVYKNCTELRKVYPEGVKKGHPAYASKMDRDNDGMACEK